MVQHKPRHERRVSKASRGVASDYHDVLSGVVELLDAARRASARVVNSLMTATYWEIGRRIVEHEQAGQRRAGYGEELVRNLSVDLTKQFGRGFGFSQLKMMRQFYQTFRFAPTDGTLAGGLTIDECRIGRSMIGQSTNEQSITIGRSATGQLVGRRATQFSRCLERLSEIARNFPLPWTHYVRLLRVRNSLAREFYTREALAGGWSVRQLGRQINTQFYEWTAMSKNKAAMLLKGEKHKPGDALSADEEIRNPLLLEFLGLKDEYSENELEESLIGHLEAFLLELGNDFAFVARQKRLRIGNEWFRVDLLFFHRRLRALIIIDLKVGELVHADVGQMNVYCNYAQEHWTQPGENPPVGLILCTDKDDSLARYAMGGLSNKMLIREYLTVLPEASALAAEISRTRQLLQRQAESRGLKRRPQ